MALDLGLTTNLLLSAMDGVVDSAVDRGRRLDDAIDRALTVPAADAAFRTEAVGRRPYIAARTGPEGLLGSISPPEVPTDWTAVQWTPPTSTWTATCSCAATSSTWAAARSPTAGTSAASCSASPPWLWTMAISACVLRTEEPARR